MDHFYRKYIEKENEFYRTLTPGTPRTKTLTPAVLNEAVDWLCQGSRSILDFGCGTGGLSFPCSLRGVEQVVGIDLAEEAVGFARACGASLPQCSFLHGSMDRLRGLADDSFDGLILSNILDNLRPEDAITALSACARTLRPGGKALVKLNPYLTARQTSEWNMTRIGDDLWDDGLLLWNRDDQFWLDTLGRYFRTVRLEDVYYEDADQHNRLFLCAK